ncbi:RusA family crossover junction endodeoxyribonuclease [Paraburkholderia fungorum]|uniref:RusA family crossover junction endodeoxyribonuclease n=1 Tax=Paraburkholderia fungorum TaxID=134537 RepID=UPI003D6C55AC
MEAVTFSMKGDPRGKGRPRATVRRFKSGNVRADTYTDAKTRRYEGFVRAIVEKVMVDRRPFVGPVSICMRFRIGVPASYSKKRRARILARQEAYYGAFDCDNLAKSILDGCNTVLFRDDKQVTRMLVIKQPSEATGIDVIAEPDPAWSIA